MFVVESDVGISRRPKLALHFLNATRRIFLNIMLAIHDSSQYEATSSTGANENSGLPMPVAILKIWIRTCQGLLLEGANPRQRKQRPGQRNAYQAHILLGLLRDSSMSLGEVCAGFELDRDFDQGTKGHFGPFCTAIVNIGFRVPASYGPHGCDPVASISCA